MKKIAVTGSSGYIGGQTAIALKDRGYYVIGLDVRPAPQHLVRYFDEFHCINIDVGWNALSSADAIIHCAGTSLVGPSIADPAEYYRNNPGNTARLLKGLHLNDWHGHFVFSSTAATYGEPITNEPITEITKQEPINPYGYSKLMCEQIIRDSSTAYKFNATVFRYFNACGADLEARHGQEYNDTHLISRICEKALGIGNFSLYGNDYPTPDGTCIRDYIHVQDIALAHIAAVENAEQGFNFYNLGTNQGYSVKEIIEAINKCSGKSLIYQTVSRREGDPAILVADGQLFRKKFNWNPENSTIETITKTAWNWHTGYIFKQYYEHRV